MFNDYGRSHGLLKDKDENLSGADVREGLICVISVKLQDVYKRQSLPLPAAAPWKEFLELGE